MALNRPVLVVLRALGLGDFLTGVPALRALRRAFPRHRLVLAAPRPLEPLARLSGAVDELADVGPLEPLPATLAGADLAVDLHGRGPESHRILLASGPRRLLAFSHPDVPASAGMPRWRADEHEVDRWCRLLEEAGVSAHPEDLHLDSRGLPAAPEEPGYTLVHPGAASGARRWPPERFAAVARGELAAGRAVLVSGGHAEVELARGVAEAAGLPASAVQAGRMDLLELAALVANAGRVVSGDTGVAHLATAFRTPSVTIFGPTPPAHWGPRVDRSLHATLWAGSAGDPHAPAPALGLLAVGAGDVAAALASLAPAPAATGRARP